MNVIKKLMEARIRLQNTELKKSGHNKFAGYYYFELGDFLPTVQKIFHELGLFGFVSYTAELATLEIMDIEKNEAIKITSPMGSANLKGCHEVQNIGAVETYQRRYLWVTAMEIVEHDILDATTGQNNHKDAPKQSAKSVPQDAMDNLPEGQRLRIGGIASFVVDHLSNDDPIAACKLIEREELDADQKVALWSLFDSKQRSLLKQTRAEMNLDS